jgi:hypothetical protein
MYETLYPGLVIDLKWFGATDDDVVVSGIATFLNQTLEGLIKRYGIEVQHLPFNDVSLPTPKIDLNMANMVVHTFRSAGRYNCEKISKVNTEEDDDYGTVKPFESYIPAYMQVEGVPDVVENKMISKKYPQSFREILEYDYGTPLCFDDPSYEPSFTYMFEDQISATDMYVKDDLNGTEDTFVFKKPMTTYEVDPDLLCNEDDTAFMFS